MDNKLQIRKIYIDSRFKTVGSASSSDFEYDLPESISLPDNVICDLDNIVIPNSWKTIDAYNNKLYCRKVSTGSGTTVITDKIITLNENNYNVNTLRDELSTKLTAAFGSGFTVSYDQVLLRYNIDLTLSTDSFKIFTDTELNGTNNFSIAYDKTNLNSANEIFTVMETQQSQNYKTGIINLMRYRNLYITCPSLSNYTTLAPNGNSNVIKKVPVTAGYGEIIYCNLLAIHDYIDVSKLLIKTLEFKICDSFGKVVNLRGVPVSFSLIFMPNNME